MSAVQRLIFGQHPAGYGARGRTFAHECLQSRLTIAAFTRRNLLERSDPRFRLVQTRERIPSNAWARKIAAPTKPITAVIVSNISNVLYATARQKTAATLHSQKDFPAPTHNPDRPRILRNRRASSCDPAPRNWGFPPRRAPDFYDGHARVEARRVKGQSFRKINPHHFDKYHRRARGDSIGVSRPGF